MWHEYLIKLIKELSQEKSILFRSLSSMTDSKKTASTLKFTDNLQDQHSSTEDKLIKKTFCKEIILYESHESFLAM